MHALHSPGQVEQYSLSLNAPSRSPKRRLPPWRGPELAIEGAARVLAVTLPFELGPLAIHPGERLRGAEEVRVVLKTIVARGEVGGVADVLSEAGDALRHGDGVV